MKVDMFQKKQSRHGLEDCKNQRNSLVNIWIIDEPGFFFKALPDTGLVQKRKQGKGAKKFHKLHFS